MKFKRTSEVITIENLISSFTTNGKANVPTYQRPLVWTDAQNNKLIDSVMRDIDMPKFMIHVDGSQISGSVDNGIVDGQQRTTALLRFFKNEYMYTPVEKDEVTGKYVKGGTSKFFGFVSLNDGEAEKAEEDFICEYNKTHTKKITSDNIFSTAEKIHFLKKYKVAVSLIETDSLEMIQEQFLRINSSGTPVSTMDCLLAQFGGEYGQTLRDFYLGDIPELEEETLKMWSYSGLSVDMNQDVKFATNKKNQKSNDVTKHVLIEFHYRFFALKKWLENNDIQTSVPDELGKMRDNEIRAHRLSSRDDAIADIKHLVSVMEKSYAMMNKCPTILSVCTKICKKLYYFSKNAHTKTSRNNQLFKLVLNCIIDQYMNNIKSVDPLFAENWATQFQEMVKEHRTDRIVFPVKTINDPHAIKQAYLFVEGYVMNALKQYEFSGKYNSSSVKN